MDRTRHVDRDTHSQELRRPTRTPGQPATTTAAVRLGGPFYR